MDQEYSRVTEFESVEFEKRLRRFELERWEGGQVEESFDDEPLPLHVQRRDRERIKKLMENLKAKHPETSGLSFTKGGAVDDDSLTFSNLHRDTVLPKGAIESHRAMLDRIYGIPRFKWEETPSGPMGSCTTSLYDKLAQEVESPPKPELTLEEYLRLSPDTTFVLPLDGQHPGLAWSFKTDSNGRICEIWEERAE